jgi:DNA-binding transcriptional LysR family regulator
MELRHLRYFVAVAEELHFGRAAERLFMAQPPLSQQIKQLEIEIGVKLFERNNRRVSLTAAGKSYLVDAYAIFQRLDDAQERAVRASRGESGWLSVAFVGSLSYDVFPDILRTFRDTYPDVELVLHELLGHEQNQALLERKIHIGFSRLPEAAPGVVHEVLSREPLLLAISADHPLARHSSVPLSFLSEEPYIQFPKSLLSGYARMVVEMCEGEGFTPKVVQKVDAVEAAISLVAAGIGVTIVPGVLRNLRRDGVVYKPFPPPGPTIDLTMAYLDGETSPILPRFLAIARDAMATQSNSEKSTQ